MAELRIGTRIVDATVVKLRAGSEGKALSAMTRDGVNNVAFKVGDDTYVASGKTLDLQDVKAWGAIRYGGEAGHVLKVDGEVLKPGFLKRWTLAGVGVGAVGMPVTGAILGSLFGAMPALWEFGLFAGVGALVFGGVAAGWAGLTAWWNGKQAQRDVLGKYAA